jgi:drug/metabolite transporter (DMT)-like permease
MAVVASSYAGRDLGAQALAGVTCIVAAMLLYVAQDGLMKLLLGEMTIWSLIVARSMAAVLILTPTILYLGRPHRLITPFWPWHLTRAVLFAFGFSLFYAAFPFMGLAEVTTIFFAAPLMTASLAAIFLRETVGLHRIGALIVGFAGVVIAMNPSDGFNGVAILPLICALTYATSQVIVRRIGDRETTLTTGLLTMGFAGVLILPMGYLVNLLVGFGPDFHHVRWDWDLPFERHLYVLILLGLIGMVGFMLLSRAYQIAPASLIAPFDYTYLPFAAAMAFLVWGEVPAVNTLIGMLMIVAGGIYLGYREVIAARRVVEPAPTAETVFVPGSPAGALGHFADTLDDRPEFETDGAGQPLER